MVDGGGLNGLTLREAIERHGKNLMSPAWPASRRFPLLVKWLDCRERLSLQVHPPAGTVEGEPKTENWYIAETEHGAHLIVGLRRGATREQFERAVASQTLEECLHRFTVAAGDSILVRSGQVHAIDAGNLILEIQQNSDTTYRVYDWGRMGLDGKPRQLHLEQSLRAIQWDSFEPVPVRAAPTSGVIADCPEFRIRRVVLGEGEHFRVEAGEQPRLVGVVSGSVDATLENADAKRPPRRLERGSNAMLPFAGAFSFAAEGTAILLVTENFV